MSLSQKCEVGLFHRTIWPIQKKSASSLSICPNLQIAFLTQLQTKPLTTAHLIHTVQLQQDRLGVRF
uniref:Uncharacterized protein n=1 Tax=Anguilla anguilla TaxID=7936 RepID=A0A0E9X2D0_ANGAN